MDQETLDHFLERLEPLAEKLGQGAEFLWGVSVRQVLLSASGWLTFAAVIVVLGLLLRKAARTQAARWQTIEDAVVAKAAEGIERNRSYRALTEREVRKALDDVIFPWELIEWVGMVLATLGLIPLWLGLARLVNPGYYAIDKMMKAVGL